jgi:hypothetical protein
MSRVEISGRAAWRFSFFGGLRQRFGFGAANWLIYVEALAKILGFQRPLHCVSALCGESFDFLR